MRRQVRLRPLITRNRKAIRAITPTISATHSSHWIPLDQPELVVAVISEMHAAVRSGKVDSTAQTGCAASSSSSTASPGPPD